MNWTNPGRATLAGLVLLGSAQAQAVGTLYAGFGGASDGVSVRSATTLTETGSFGVAGEVNGIAAGQGSNLYLATGDSVSNVTISGMVTATDTVANAGYSDVAVLGANLWVAATGTADGLSRRDLNTLVEAEFIATAFEPTSIEDGFGRLYVTAGDTLYVFSNTGAELTNAAADAGVTFVDSALSGTRLYAVTGGAANGVSVRNPITLAEITDASFALPFAVEGVVAGDNDDLYLTSGGNVFHYSTAGVELDAAATGRALTDITFIADPLPPTTGTALAITASAAGDSISIRDAETLANAGGFDVVASAATGIALGPLNDDLYLAAGDTLFHYGAAGALLESVQEAGVNFTDVALVDGDLIASFTDGFSIRNADTLVEMTAVTGLGFTPASISAGNSGEVYMTSGNVVYRYNIAGSQLALFAANSALTFTDVALVNSVVYATYNSSTQNGISVLDPGSLDQSDVIEPTIAATGIGAGGANDYYISGGNEIVHYALDEELARFTAAQGTTFPDVVFSPEGSSELTSVVAAILPSSRSVQVGNTASAFATVINTGPVTASNCRIEPAAGSNVPGVFSYQTTDGGTNELVGTPNTPADIAANNGNQSFFFSFVPDAPFAAAEVALDFACSNAPAAPVFEGVNTLLLSADTDPVPDVVALAATVEGTGIVNIPGVGGTGFFSVSSVNVGAAGEIAVTAALTDGDPAVALSICETNPATGACINPTAPTTGAVNVTIGAGDTPTFSIFATGSSAVALDAAGKRIRVLFADQTGAAPRGATSVAVRTQ